MAHGAVMQSSLRCASSSVASCVHGEIAAGGRGRISSLSVSRTSSSSPLVVALKAGNGNENTRKRRAARQQQPVVAALGLEKGDGAAAAAATNGVSKASQGGVAVVVETPGAQSSMEVDAVTEAELKENGFRSTRRTKLICTIGPATCAPEQLEALAMGGMNVARINMCHGTREWHTQVIRDVRSLNSEKGYSVAIMMDTEGSEIHLGDFNGAPSVKAEVSLQGFRKYFLAYREFPAFPCFILNPISVQFLRF